MQFVAATPRLAQLARRPAEEEADECCKLNQVLGGIELAPVNVNRIGKRLKGVKADADWQNDLHAPWMYEPQWHPTRQSSSR